MTWNSEKEHYLKNLGEQAMAYTWMQEQTAMFYSRLDRNLGIFIIILSAAIGTNNFLDTELNSRQIIFGIIGYFVSILGMFSQFIKPMEVSQTRSNVGNKFQDIYYDIKQQLSKSKDERKDSDEYIELITSRFIELYDFAPSLNNFIINRFKKTFKSSNISMPLTADFIDEIRIFDQEIISNNNTNECNNIDIEMGISNSESYSNKNNEFQKFILDRLN